MPVVIEALMDEPFRQVIRADGHAFFADVDRDKGGQATAPNPHHLLFGAWGACTAMTIQMYARRKGWKLESITVSFDEVRQTGQPPLIYKKIQISGDLTPEQQQALERIAEKCPVNQLITGEKRIEQTFLFGSAPASEAIAGKQNG
ncbi:MAG TPA: OsmC family protein [Oculatellaceae cyanobacterium]